MSNPVERVRRHGVGRRDAGLKLHHHNLYEQVNIPHTQVAVNLSDASYLKQYPDAEDYIGSKARGLMEMRSWGLPIPQGFVITSDVCFDLITLTDRTRGISDNIGGLRRYKSILYRHIRQELQNIEEETEKKLGNRDNPLFLSVRSGAKESMPGIMDTYLYVGLNDDTYAALIEMVGLQRATQTYVELIYGLNTKQPKTAAKKSATNVPADITLEDAQEIIAKAKDRYKEDVGGDFPQDPNTQFFQSVMRVSASWHSQRAVSYRRDNMIPDFPGTACTVVEMIPVDPRVSSSGSGVVLTADPHTNEPTPVLSFAPCQQGNVAVGDGTEAAVTWDKMEPSVRDQLQAFIRVVREHKVVIQDMEFTVNSQGEVVFLQTKDVKMEPLAKVNLLLELIERGEITIQQAVKSLKGSEARRLLFKTFRSEDVASARNSNLIVASGFAPCSGSFVGRVAYSLEEASRVKGKKVVLVADLTLEESSHLPDTVGAIVCGTFAVASHGARHLETFAESRSNVSVIVGADLARLRKERPKAVSVFVDGHIGECVPYKMRLDQPPQLSESQRNLIRLVNRKKKRNPWLFLAQSSPDVGAKSKYNKPPYRSIKAKEEWLTQRFIPEEIREKSYIHAVQNTDRAALKTEVRASLLNCLCEASGVQKREAAIRTCHEPALSGKAPWKLFKTAEEIDVFLNSGEFDALCDTSIEGAQLEAVIASSVHAGKLDKEKVESHFCGSVIATTDGTVIVQITPGEIHLRGNEVNGKAAKPAVTSEVATTQLGPWKPARRKIAGLRQFDRQKENLTMVTRGILMVENWIIDYDLLNLMAGLTASLPKGFSIPSLQFQGRLLPDNNVEVWVYGINSDKKSRSKR